MPRAAASVKMAEAGRNISSDSNESGIIRSRVVRACDRCRVRKSKCNGEYPCDRCTQEDDVCAYTERKKSQDKVYPKGYPQMLEDQQERIVAGLREMYKRLLNGDSWEGPPLKNQKGGFPLTHDILTALGTLKPPQLDAGPSVFQDNFEVMQSQLLAAGSGYEKPRAGPSKSKDGAAPAVQTPDEQSASTPTMQVSVPATSPMQRSPASSTRGARKQQPGPSRVQKRTSADDQRPKPRQLSNPQARRATQAVEELANRTKSLPSRSAVPSPSNQSAHHQPSTSPPQSHEWPMPKYTGSPASYSQPEDHSMDSLARSGVAASERFERIFEQQLNSAEAQQRMRQMVLQQPHRMYNGQHPQPRQQPQRTQPLFHQQQQQQQQPQQPQQQPQQPQNSLSAPFSPSNMDTDFYDLFPGAGGPAEYSSFNFDNALLPDDFGMSMDERLPPPPLFPAAPGTTSLADLTMSGRPPPHHRSPHA